MNSINQGNDADAPVRPNLNPEQFSISELFWVLGSVAILLAIATPFLRRLDAEVFNVVLVVISLQAVVITFLVVFVSRRRKKLLERGGELLARGSLAESPSRRWALAIALLSILLAVFAQLFITVMLSVTLATETKRSLLSSKWFVVVILSNMFGPTLLLLNVIRFLRWRIDASVVEFFENGIATMDTLIPWEQVELRRSIIWRDRVMVVYPKLQTSGMVWMDESQVDKMIDFADARKSGND